MNYSTEQLKQTGIYAIVHRESGKRYIGSTAQSFRIRWNAHKRDLINNKHHSIYLQRAWIKYGSDAFDFVILETIREDLLFEWLLKREQWWVDLFGSATRQLGYNICPTAGNCLGVKHDLDRRKRRPKEYIVTNPSGEQFSTNNLRKLCRENDLNADKMTSVAKGKNSNHKGWKCEYSNPEEKSLYPKFTPKGNEGRIEAGKKRRGAMFTDEHRARIGAAGKGRKQSQETKDKRAAKMKGRFVSEETKQKSSAKRSKEWLVTFPDGEVKIIKNLNQFCLKNNLSPGLMSMVASKKRDHHKGWKCERLL